MPSLRILPDNVVVEVSAQDTILEAAQRAGIDHAHACGGHARCSTCRVSLVDAARGCAPRTPEEAAMAERLELPDDVRLACQTKITCNDEVCVRRLVLDEADLHVTREAVKGMPPGVHHPVGEEKPIAVLFADIRGFTPLSSALPPYDVVHLLNRYFHRMGPIIEQNGGEIDNYIGDGLLARFGAPDPRAACAGAVRAALEMQEAMAPLSAYTERAFGRPIAIGVGVHYGPAVVGLIGAHGRMRVTAIGDTVNIASRVESATKAAGASVLITEATLEPIRDLADVRAHDGIALKGKEGGFTLYQVLGLRDA